MGGQVSTEGVHVVVVGGGFGGIAAAQDLKYRGFSFTLIDMRDAFHHNPGALRAAVQPDTDRQLVILEGGREVQYSHLILCTGTDGPFPGKFNTVASHKEAVQKYEDFIREVRSRFYCCLLFNLFIYDQETAVVTDAVMLNNSNLRKKEHEKLQEHQGLREELQKITLTPLSPPRRSVQVVLIHSKLGLADPELLPSIRREANQVLLEKGVELVLGQKVSKLSELPLNTMTKNTEVMTDHGETLVTDLIVCCTGLKINSAAYSATFNDSMAENGALKVNDHLQVDGFSNIFAVGDCANVNEPKTAYNAGLHAAVAVANIANSVSGKELTSYQTGNVTMLLAMGHDDGVGQYNGFRLPRWFVAWGKSRDVLVWKSWREMKQKQP
ncbi:apoptosis-inducing factor 2 [Neolamprologus brichardi]|uniref:apoptosis-inducing factor 2 n=1 Tax=Neolamprologus brichardi TaxID=32507 RepID=UPI001643CC52|nr:apoptosis-inducing factor 2 [Neolamprologus brichardi]